VLWSSKALEGQHSDPVIVDGFVYGYSGNNTNNKGKLECLRLSDGKRCGKAVKLELVHLLMPMVIWFALTLKEISI